MKSLANISELKMSSMEIAELTGKEHKNVMRDIRTMLIDLHGEGGVLSFEHTHSNPQNGQIYPVFQLPKRESLILVSGYNLQMRARIIDRWQELEGKQHLVLPNFNNPAEAARAWALQYEQAQIAIATKAEIGSRREATAMNTASRATKKANQLEIQLDTSKQYCTIKRMTMLTHGVKFDRRPLKATSIEMGLEPIAVFDQNYGSVLAYHMDVWREAYALDLAELAGGAA